MSPESGPRTTCGALDGRGDRRGRLYSGPDCSRGLVSLLVFCIFFVAFEVSPAWARHKDASVAFGLTIEGLHAVGGFPPQPTWSSYYAPWSAWGPPWWVPPLPLAVGPYPSDPTATPSWAYPPLRPEAPNYPASIKPAGRLVIIVDPVEAEVYVDGVRLPQRANRWYEVGLLAGPHRVDIRQEGFKSLSEAVDIPPGGGLVLSIQLEKQ